MNLNVFVFFFRTLCDSTCSLALEDFASVVVVVVDGRDVSILAH